MQHTKLKSPHTAAASLGAELEEAAVKKTLDFTVPTQQYSSFYGTKPDWDTNEPTPAAKRVDLDATIHASYYNKILNQNVQSYEVKVAEPNPPNPPTAYNSSPFYGNLQNSDINR